MMNRVGTQFGGYHLIRLLGSTTFAEVYLAESRSSGPPVAIKVFSLPRARDEMERLHTSVHTIARLSHPALLPIKDYGWVGDASFLVMDYAPHGSLRTMYPQGAILDRRSALLSILKELVPVIQFVHDHSLVHGNIKPENILLSPTRTLLLSDFSLVVEAAGRRAELSVQKALTGAYLAPEQLDGRIHYASDQYALAMMVYEWLSGTVPFPGSIQQRMQQRLVGDSTSLEAVISTIPSSLADVIQKALAREPEHRFATVQAFVHELELAYRSSLPTSEFALSTSSTHVSLLPTEPLLAPASDRPSMGTVLCTYHGHNHYVYTLSWSPDSTRIVSGSRDKTAQIWDTTHGACLVTYPHHLDGIEVVAWSPQGKHIASGGMDGIVRVWDATSGQTLFVYRSSAPIVHTLTWSPDGKYLASDVFQHAEIWPALTGHPLLMLSGHSSAIKAIDWSPTGVYLATASTDHTIRIWNVATGGTQVLYRGHSRKVLTVAWSLDGTLLASGGRDHTVHIWGGTPVSTHFIYREHSTPVSTVAWSPDGAHIASGSEDGIIHVWETLTGNTVFVYRGHSATVFNRINAVRWSPDGTRIASASDDGTVQVWRAP